MRSRLSFAARSGRPTTVKWPWYAGTTSISVSTRYASMPNTAALNVLKSIPRCLREQNSRGRGLLRRCCKQRTSKRIVMLGILRGDAGARDGYSVFGGARFACGLLSGVYPSQSGGKPPHSKMISFGLTEWFSGVLGSRGGVGGLRAMSRLDWRRNVILMFFASVLGGAEVARAQSKSAGAGDAVSLNNQGLERYKKGRVDEAIELFRQALALNPNFPEALSNLGLALDSKGKDDEAISDFDKALALKPSDAVTESNLGLALYHEKKYYDSISTYRKAIALNPKFAQAYNGMGAALLASGNATDAVAAYRRALELMPRYVDALNNLAAALDSTQP